MSTINFSELPILLLVQHLQQAVYPSEHFNNFDEFGNDKLLDTNITLYDFNSAKFKHHKYIWQTIQNQKNRLACKGMSASIIQYEMIENEEVDWLITLFNSLFTASRNVNLIRGKDEPEYFPATNDSPARIEFAHGFFQSALHEISHWCLAGKYRRTLPDFGYWYAPDGRNEAQQKAFEKVEIKPQAIECLFSLMCGRQFKVSLDNLHADFDTSQSTFSKDVYDQAKLYITEPQRLPIDAKTLLTAMSFICHDTI